MNKHPSKYFAPGMTSAKENRVARLERDPIQRIVALMNLYHSLDNRYFATQKLRDDAEFDIRKEILTLNHDVSLDIQDAIKDSLRNKKYWDNIKDRLF